MLTIEGFHTAAVVDTPFYTRDGMNYDRGFRTFIEVPGQEYWRNSGRADVRRTWHSESDRFAPQTFTKAAEWLEKHYKEDFFLYIDAWDPHEPWDAPNSYTYLYLPDYDGEQVSPPYAYWQDIPGLTEEKVNKAHATYCGELTMVDTWIGYFLKRVEELGLMEKTAIIFTSDHGFYFGEHGGIFGKMVRDYQGATAFGWETDAALSAWTYSPLYEEVVACPLLVYVPGVTPGVYKGLTSAVDLMPSVLSVLGQEAHVKVEGCSLLPIITNCNQKGREFVISTHPFTNQLTLIRSVDGQPRLMKTSSVTTVTTDEWSLLYNVEPGQSLLYHLPSDPKQEKNIINEHLEIARDIHQLLVKFMHEHNLPQELCEPRLQLRL